MTGQRSGTLRSLAPPRPGRLGHLTAPLSASALHSQDEAENPGRLQLRSPRENHEQLLREFLYLKRKARARSWGGWEELEVRTWTQSLGPSLFVRLLSNRLSEQESRELPGPQSQATPGNACLSHSRTEWQRLVSEGESTGQGVQRRVLPPFTYSLIQDLGEISQSL